MEEFKLNLKRIEECKTQLKEMEKFTKNLRRVEEFKLKFKENGGI